MDDFKEKYGPWALITGASAGIGLEFANKLAARGLNLILVARRKERLDAIAGNLKGSFNISVKTIQVDLEKANFINSIIDASEGLEIGLLVNNAGYALTGEFLKHTLDEEQGLLHLNCRAPLMLTHLFGRKMVDMGRGGIIFVSSIAAFLPMPLWTHYSASKAYNLYLACGLYYELKERGVDVLALCPGHTKTEFAEVAGIKTKGMDVKPVVNLALKSLGKKPHAVPGLGNRIITFMPRLMSMRGNIKTGATAVRGMLEQ